MENKFPDTKVDKYLWLHSDLLIVKIPEILPMDIEITKIGKEPPQHKWLVNVYQKTDRFDYELNLQEYEYIGSHFE